jgi:hypothetical protein
MANLIPQNVINMSGNCKRSSDYQYFKDCCFGEKKNIKIFISEIDYESFTLRCLFFSNYTLKTIGAQYLYANLNNMPERIRLSFKILFESVFTPVEEYINQCFL